MSTRNHDNHTPEVLFQNGIFQLREYFSDMDREKWSTRQQSLVEALKNMRVISGMTQVELAVKLNRPQSYISKYEKGERRLDLIELSEICDACNTSLSEFVKVIERKK